MERWGDEDIIIVHLLIHMVSYRQHSTQTFIYSFIHSKIILFMNFFSSNSACQEIHVIPNGYLFYNI